MDSNELHPGDIVKSLDFPGNSDHYIIARVLDVDCGLVSAICLVQVSDGLSVPASGFEKFSFPAQGEHFMDDKFPGRITLIAKGS